MKKYLIIIIIVIVLIVLGFIFFFYNSNTNNNNANNETLNTVSGERISVNINESLEENRISNIIQNQNEIMNNSSNQKEISSYSIAIKDQSAGRLTNISITCSTLNNTIVKSGETFSFNKIVVEPTTARGYQEASVIIDHKTEKGIGGRKLPSK